MSTLFSYWGKKRKNSNSSSLESSQDASSPLRVGNQNNVGEVGCNIQHELPSSSSESMLSLNSEKLYDESASSLPVDSENRNEINHGNEIIGIDTNLDNVSACEQHTIVSVSAFFENTNNPCQPYLKSYPERKIGSKKRAFNSDWYKYKWLEYCQELDACFCFACRVFLPH